MIPIPKKIVEKIEVPYASVKDFLRKREESGELSALQNLTLDVTSKLSKTDLDKAEKIISKLIEDFKISRFSATQIANILPKNIEELRTLLIAEGKVFLTNELQKMLDTIKSLY